MAYRSKDATERALIQNDVKRATQAVYANVINNVIQNVNGVIEEEARKAEEGKHYYAHKPLDEAVLENLKRVWKRKLSGKEPTFQQQTRADPQL